MLEHEQLIEDLKKESETSTQELPETKEEQKSDKKDVSARDFFGTVGLGLFLGFMIGAVVFNKDPDRANEPKVGVIYHPYNQYERKGDPFVLLYNGHRVPQAFQVKKPIPSSSFQVIKVKGEIIYFPLNQVTEYTEE